MHRCIIVDSTKNKAKCMSDALSKTVPIWCAVWNRVLFPELSGTEHELCTPREAVSEEEHKAIEERIDGWVEQLRVRGDLAYWPDMRLISVPSLCKYHLGSFDNASRSPYSQCSFHPSLVKTTFLLYERIATQSSA